MPDYNNSKIYKIEGINSEGEILTYYGSTTQTLARRLTGHIDSNKRDRGTTSRFVIENTDYKIILVESFPCKNKEELVAKEYFYIQNNKCVNKYKYNNKMCEHNRERTKCRDCGGGSICEHQQRRCRCVECEGGSICIHKKRRDKCKDCRSK